MGFVKGQSGNVKGRPPRTDTEKRQRAQIRMALPGIIERLIEQATVDGDTTAARLLLERVMPAWKPVDRPAPIALGADIAAAGQSVLAALSDGTLSPDQASSIAATLDSLARTAELIEFEKRIAAIEADLNERKTTK